MISIKLMKNKSLALKLWPLITKRRLRACLSKDLYLRRVGKTQSHLTGSIKGGMATIFLIKNSLGPKSSWLLGRLSRVIRDLKCSCFKVARGSRSSKCRGGARLMIIWDKGSTSITARRCFWIRERILWRMKTHKIKTLFSRSEALKPPPGRTSTCVKTLSEIKACIILTSSTKSTSRMILKLRDMASRFSMSKAVQEFKVKWMCARVRAKKILMGRLITRKESQTVSVRRTCRWSEEASTRIGSCKRLELS